MNEKHIILGIIFTIFIYSLVLILAVQPYSPTPLIGHSTVQSGNISLSISSYISLRLTDSIINFGACAINETKGYSLFDSNLSNSSGDNYLCLNASYPDFMVIENDGTQRVNLTVQIAQSGDIFFNDSTAWFSFKSLNKTTRPGCGGFLQSNYTNFSLGATEYVLCDDFTTGVNNQLEFYMQAYVTLNSSGGGNTTVQFTGVSI